MYSCPFRAGDRGRTDDIQLGRADVLPLNYTRNDSDRTRTYDRLLRRQLLYPTELITESQKSEF